MKHISSLTVAKADWLLVEVDDASTNIFDLIISLLGGGPTMGANIFDVILSVLPAK